MLRLSRFTSLDRRSPSAAIARTRLSLALSADRNDTRTPAGPEAPRQPRHDALLARLLHETPQPEGERQ